MVEWEFPAVKRKFASGDLLVAGLDPPSPAGVSLENGTKISVPSALEDAVIYVMT